MAVVADEHVLAPILHLTHEDPDKPNPALQVRAVVLEVQVAAPYPQATHELAVEFK